MFHRQVDATRLQATYQPLLDLVPQLGVAIVLFAGGLAVTSGALTIGGFFAFNLYLAMLVMPLRMLGMWVGQVQRAVASGSRVFELLDEEPDDRAAGRIRCRCRPARASCGSRASASATTRHGRCSTASISTCQRVGRSR